MKVSGVFSWCKGRQESEEAGSKAKDKGISGGKRYEFLQASLGAYVSRYEFSSIAVWLGAEVRLGKSGHVRSG